MSSDILVDSSSKQESTKEKDESYDVSPTNSISAKTCQRIRKRRRNGEKYMDVAEDEGLKPYNVVSHIRGHCDCSVDETPITRETEKQDKPWAEKELLRKLFIVENIDYKKIGVLFGCNHETVKTWAREKHEITMIADEDQSSSAQVRELLRIGIRNEEEESDLPPEAKDTPYGK